MENGSSSQPKPQTQQRDRLASPSRASVPRNSLSPDDGYDYKNTGPSPEGSATQEKEHLNPADPHIQSTAGSNATEQYEQHQEDFNPDYRRHAGGWRAQLPDDEDQNGVPLPVDINTQPPLATSKSARKHRWRLRKDVNEPIHLEPIGKTHLRYVMLQWEKEEFDGAQKLVLHALLPGVSAKIESPNHVIWQHSELKDMRLDQFEDIINRWKSRGLKESEAGLTRRLLNRVRTQYQRPFVGGSFLTPVALRYLSLDDSKYSADKCSIFFNFPYFAVTDPQDEKPFVKGDPEHPVRTLLQSHYRLNRTDERDKNQCIRMLEGNTLKSCAEVPKTETAHLGSKALDELIYVPQLWGLIIGLNKMITMGPIDDIALQGSAIKIKDNNTLPEARRCAFIRISFSNQGSLEELTYPREQCASWFGLMNKHKQILEILEKSKEHTDPKKYKLHIKSRVIQPKMWCSVQSLAREEVLNLWMKTPRPDKPAKPDIPRLAVKNPEGDSDQDSKLTLEIEDDSGDEERSTAEASAIFDDLDPVPVVSAFLTWDIRDEFGEKDDSSNETKVNRFLNAIYRALPAVCQSDIAEPSASAIRAEQMTPIGTSARPRMTVEGKTLSEVQDLVYSINSSTPQQEYPTERRMLVECVKLFNWFIPETHKRNVEPIKLFWGAFYELMNYRRPHIAMLLEKIELINSWAEHIHLGVHYRRIERNSAGCETQKNTISESAILLASVVDALGAIFNMLLEAVRNERLRSKSSQEKKLLISKVSDYGDEACELLETARNKLITEATGAASGENVGPVLTPEAISIMLMERLVRGVFGSGNVEVIAVYEECLEHLVLKVKSRASRRLLETINAFEEEVAIVNNVLLQQKKVLEAFCGYLNPLNFKRASTARKMRFEFEKKGIERILTTIREQLRYCTELRERARVLAVQDVHLVETLQDDNSRAIFIFTFITILFLPLSFVASFFGMNVVGINPTTSSTSHFWVIALPVTGGIMMLCAIVVFKGEDVWFLFADLLRWCRKTVSDFKETHEFAESVR